MMSVSDFLIQRLLGLKASMSTSVPASGGSADKRNIPDIVMPRVSMNLADPLSEYAAALQLMQLQMFCQPNFLNSLLSQMAVMGFGVDCSGSSKVASSLETSSDAPAALVHERKRVASRGGSAESYLKRPKLLRRLVNDSETSSPVSGMFIKEASSLPPPDELQAAADMDETAVFVNVSEESRRKIQQIPNIIGDCICALCKVRYDDVFRLAQHRCPRIIHEEYRCPECDKKMWCSYFFIGFLEIRSANPLQHSSGFRL
ncbi:unnamed protein product [Gongylonema pulchrum]|uniref:C2H2-type domain-containing protein n=1 Tax=Gongylonema pulchrum TaxID=637853 RepID=A0A183CVS9_9BILA|nr:unnamed protein product [Gongylonema pulchrum]